MEGFSQGSGLVFFLSLFCESGWGTRKLLLCRQKGGGMGALVPLCLYAVTSEMGEL